MKRKHRLHLDVTFNRKLTKREAAKATRLLLSELDLDAGPIYLSQPPLYADKITAMEKK